MGWSILSGFSALQLVMVFVIQWLVLREKRQESQREAGRDNEDSPGVVEVTNDGVGEVGSADDINTTHHHGSSSVNALQTVTEETKKA